ncbi:enoyl-CoA hydratase/isomerase family protein [Salarchaeum sp. JOR-1]|uniref:enoyl-CoA hydratase/isomerase family protein n=1 Tax=Salarchaeum sp. JOR-1 TaxID=2599399 RepID=UPI001198BABC|nr:enoyl-CoA hydratase/isomerase family protein [Salarchaeum sp. JOR-1]QDX40471.1 enoyl-CoA hydratase/isomerase family protein [Salarchaeum sp. JOR-1]
MLSIRDEERVRVVTLDRPERRNALTPAGLDALADAVRDAEQAVVYVHGAGSAFCAGADLDVVRDLDGESAPAFAERGQAALNAVEDADSAVVAGVDGAARGGGVELALACDVRVATPDATFAEPGVSMGIFGAWGGTRRLPRAIGEANALDLSLSGRTVDAATAREMGLVSRVTDTPRAVADELARNDPDALHYLKRLLREQYDRDEQDAREREAFGALLEDGL